MTSRMTSKRFALLSITIAVAGVGLFVVPAVSKEPRPVISGGELPDFLEVNPELASKAVVIPLRPVRRPSAEDLASAPPASMPTAEEAAKLYPAPSKEELEKTPIVDFGGTSHTTPLTFRESPEFKYPEPVTYSDPSNSSIPARVPTSTTTTTLVKS